MPAARINDYAVVLSPAERARLEANAAAQEGRTGHQIAVAVFRSLEGENLEDVSIRLAQQWRLGQQGLDNGAILLVFVDDRRLRIEVGYGLEDRLTDAAADAIIRNEIAPRFREGRYADGLEAGLAAIYRVIAGEAGARPADHAPDPLVLGAVGLIALILIGAMASQLRRRNVHRRGYTAGPDGWYSGPGGFGGIPGGFGSGGGGFAGGGGFRGGGGGFGGGGASGRW